MSFLKQIKLLSVLVFTIIVVGCVSAPQQKLTNQAKQTVNTIALLTIPDPEVYTAANIGGMKGLFLGPIGGYLEALDNEAYSKSLTEKMQQLNHQMGSMLLREIEKGLIRKNYSITLLDQRPGIKENGEADYSDIQTNADVILDVWFRAAGYVSPPNSIGYEPYLFVSSRMVSAGDKAQLYFQAFNYAAKIGYVDNIIFYNQVGSKEYSSLDKVIDNTLEAGNELMLGIPLIANGICNEL